MRQLGIDLTDRVLLRNPYPSYAILRQEAPVYHVVEDDLYVVTRYEDVKRVLKDHEFFSSRGMARLHDAGLGRSKDSRDAALEAFSEGLKHIRNVVTSDPPDHTAQRKFLANRFTPRQIETWSVGVRELVEGLMQQLVEKNLHEGRVDFARDFAYPLPLLVIADMLGVPRELRMQLRGWSDRASRFFSGAPLTLDVQHASIALTSFFAQQVAQRRKSFEEGTASDAETTDLITLLLKQNPTDDPGSVLNDGEIVQTCVLLLIAGHETTANLLGNMLHALIQFPDVCRWLEREPARIPDAVEEVLRWDSPVQGMYRLTRTDVEIAGTRIPAGKMVLAMIGSANRDETVFENPHLLDLDRKNKSKHIAFGAGSHTCLGAPLSRMEARIGMEVFLSHATSLRLAGEPERVEGNIFKGWQKLPLHFDVKR